MIMKIAAIELETVIGVEYHQYMDIEIFVHIIDIYECEWYDVGDMIYYKY